MYPRKSITTPTATKQQANLDPRVISSKLKNSMLQSNSTSPSPISNKNENRSKMSILPPLSKSIPPPSNNLNLSYISMSIPQQGNAIQEHKED